MVRLGMEVDTLIEQIMRHDGAWNVPSSAIALADSLSWAPHLVRNEEGELGHVHLGDRLRPYLVERMQAASESGRTVYFFCELDDLYDPDTLAILSDVDPQISIISSNGVSGNHDLLRTVSEQGVTVTPSLRSLLGRASLERCRSAPTAAEKGRRLESLLAFLMSQVEDFNVHDVNRRTETEELDVVVQQRSINGARCWSGAPFIFVEAKNWTDKVGQAEVTLLWGKLEGKGSVARIGILVGLGGFTSDASKQCLRFSTGARTLVLVGVDELSGWIEAADGDSFLEDLVAEAMLR